MSSVPRKKIVSDIEPSKLGDVTSLKVVLALLLVGTHGLTHIHGVSSRSTHLAPVVPVFMFLSGYFMLANYKRTLRPLHFVVARYLKLLPIMVVSLVVMLGLFVLYYGFPMPIQVAAALPEFILAHLTFFQTHVPADLVMPDVRTQNPSLWFIEAILVLYVTLPLVALIERRFKGLLLVLCTASAGVSVFIPAYTGHAGGLQNLVAFQMGLEDVLPSLVHYVLRTIAMVAQTAWMFYAGCLIRRYQAWLFTPGIAVLLICTSLSVTLLLYIVGAGNWNHFGVTPPWYVPGYLAAWIVLHKCCLQNLSLPPISIGLFVLHFPVFNAFNYLGLDQLWFAALVVIILAWTSLHILERPMDRALSRLPFLRAPRAPNTV